MPTSNQYSQDSSLVNSRLKTKAKFLVKKPQEFLSNISPLNPLELKEIQEYLWDVIMDESESHKLGITRSDIISRFEPTTNYQYRAACKEPLGYCTLNMCIKLDERCATNRLRGMIEVLRKIMADIYTNENLDAKLAEFEAKTKPADQGYGIQFNQNTFLDVSKDSENKDVNYGFQIKQKVKNLREILFSVIEIEGAETVILLDKGGNIIEMVSNSRVNTSKVNQIIVDILSWIQKIRLLIKAEKYNVLTNEFEHGLMVMRPLENSIDLVIFNRENDKPAFFIQTTARIAKELNDTLRQSLEEAKGTIKK